MFPVSDGDDAPSSQSLGLWLAQTPSSRAGATRDNPIIVDDEIQPCELELERELVKTHSIWMDHAGAMFADEPDPTNEREVELYFTRNTFYWPDDRDFSCWVTFNKRYCHLLCRVHVDTALDNRHGDPHHVDRRGRSRGERGGRFTNITEGLLSCPGLRELIVGVDETAIIQTAYMRDINRINLSVPTSIDRQINLDILRLDGMDELRQMYVPYVSFMGSIPGGVLETVVAREMMGSRAETGEEDSVSIPSTGCGVHAERHFRFLDLPGEMRNRIYSQVMLIDGKISPVHGRTPASELSYRASDGRVYHVRAAPQSALALLATNKQIFEEAVGIYYGHNRFAFYFQYQLTPFLRSISATRKEYISDVTLWYEAFPESAEVALPELLSLKNLKRLEILLDPFVSHHSRCGKALGHDSHFHSKASLRQLASQGVDVRFRCTFLEDPEIWVNTELCSRKIRLRQIHAEMQTLQEQVSGKVISVSRST